MSEYVNIDFYELRGGDYVRMACMEVSSHYKKWFKVTEVFTDNSLNILIDRYEGNYLKSHFDKARRLKRNTKPLQTTDGIKVGDKVRYCNRVNPSIDAGEWLLVDQIEGTYSLTINGKSYPITEFDDVQSKPLYKHDAIIRAWLDGKVVQVRHGDKWADLSQPDNRSSLPAFDRAREYRIKPEKTETELKIEQLEKQAKDIQKSIQELKNL